jgi:protein tyrosine phosphatase (PTP) superfamily phosphohydrolase (DUF442 family)
MRHRFAIVLGLVVGCGTQSITTSSGSVANPVETKGLHNAFRVSDQVYSGSSPEGDEGFAELRRLGVRTIISVDGAKPDAETATRYGLRYVHLPVGYDGIPRDKVLALVKAVKELPGPVYVHCHHGRHRGPAAVAAIQLCTDPTWDPGRAEAWLRTAGTDPRYTGLVGIPRSLVPPTADELARAPSEFPSAARIPDLAQFMVGIDELWDRLKLVKDAGWKTPKDHPDVDPPHELLLLLESYREAARLVDSRRRGPEFAKRLADAEAAVTELDQALRAMDFNRSEAVFTRSAAACIECHTQFRDRPSER